MFGAFKCCGVGARMLRNGSPIGHGVSPGSLDALGVGDMYTSALICCGNLNWSQRRFLRGSGMFTGGPRNANAQFMIKEIESQLRQEKQKQVRDLQSDKENVKEQELRRFCRSLREHQSLLLTALPDLNENMGQQQEELLCEITKLIVEDAPAIVRVKSRKDETLLKEWIGVQRELRTIRRERLDEYKRKLEIAGQQALKEMETNLNKGMDLDDLDQAIEGALCSQAKAEYTQKSSHDN